MIQKAILITALTLAMLATKAHAQTGTWRNYLAYNDITDVQQAGNTLFVLASEALYSYNTNDQSITTYDKTNGLSDCGIQHIAWCADASRLIAVYENGNIDLVSRDGQTENMPEYYNYSTTLDKTVYGLDVIGSHAYMSTGFGIVNINVADAEVTETYNLGFRVDYVYADASRIYAASSTNGTYSALLTANLLDPGNWTYTTPYTPRQKTIDPDLLATAQTLKPGGPRRNWFGFMKFANGKLYTCGGPQAVDIPGTIQIFDNGEWNIYQEEGISQQTGVNYQNMYCLDIDPNDTTHVFAGARNGLYEYRNGQFTNYYGYQNSPIEIYNGTSIEYQIIGSVMFDSESNLWLLNCSAPTQSIIEFTNNGQWTSHEQQDLMKLESTYQGQRWMKSLAGMQKLMTDSRGLMWFVNNNWVVPSFYAYQPSTNALASFIPQYNQNGATLNIQQVRCIAEDHDGNMWVGTNVGPLLLYASEITSENPVFTQFIVPRNDGTNYGDYLLNGIDINAVAIDGAGRKWFGTNGNGVYLISEDNIEQIQHFTTENSPLLSDNIQSIAINGTTGEVFFGTEKGLCSYMSNATEPSTEMTKDNVYAYPNPVRPDYTGPITIVGLTYDADVKITTSNGVLVNQGRSTGGTYQWDGCDLEGRRVASGVYMVQTATSSGEKGTVCKIGIVN